MTIEERFTKIMEHWFIMEPALFAVLCTHKFEENSQMACPLRTGHRMVQYNPLFVHEMSDECLEQALRAEAIRILLKHPYERKPDMCSQEAIAIGSNLVIGDNYNFSKFEIEEPATYNLDSKQTYEWYCRQIQMQMQKSRDGDGAGENGDDPFEGARNRNTDLSELWDEDEMALMMINGIINTTKDWGSLKGQFVEMLKASTKAKIDWRKVFAGFRASILSSKRKLTRMKPNRRTGFENMGSMRKFDTKLLVAVDVSGSISTENLTYFYGVINSAFRYGFTEVDVIQFDCGVQKVESLKKVIRDVSIIGRGGTSFNEPIAYAHEHGYDGLVILTDGYANEPKIPEGFRTKIMWVCEDTHSYERHHKWMRKYGRVCTMQIA